MAFFALFGFIFLITQYFQFIRGYGTLSTGARILPVRAQHRRRVRPRGAPGRPVGTRVIVVTGLRPFGRPSCGSPSSRRYRAYLTIAAQMLIMGLGLGLTTAPGHRVHPERAPAGQGRDRLGRQRRHPRGRRTLGVAVIGSVASSIYLHHLAGTAVAHLPGPLAAGAP